MNRLILKWVLLSLFVAGEIFLIWGLFNPPSLREQARQKNVADILSQLTKEGQALSKPEGSFLKDTRYLGARDRDETGVVFVLGAVPKYEVFRNHYRKLLEARGWRMVNEQTSQFGRVIIFCKEKYSSNVIWNGPSSGSISFYGELDTGSSRRRGFDSEDYEKYCK